MTSSGKSIYKYKGDTFFILQIGLQDRKTKPRRSNLETLLVSFLITLKGILAEKCTHYIELDFKDE